MVRRTIHEELKKFLGYQKSVSDKIRDIRAIVANYNLPYLSLPSHTDKSVALDVFINMNTNSKPLSTYDIIVAEVESAMGESLHDLQEQLVTKAPDVAKYSCTVGHDFDNISATTAGPTESAWGLGHGQKGHGGELGCHGVRPQPDGAVSKQ